jgi:hypothetical protein
MKICRLALGIDKVAIHPTLVDTVQLTLIEKQVRLA